ncbi:MAG: lactate utilization protein [Bacillota bacterium]
MDNIGEFYAERAGRVVAALNRNLFEALYAPDGEQAVEEIMKRIPAGATVGAGGSVTLRQLGVLELLKQKGHQVFDHWQEGLDPAAIDEIRRRQITADVFLSSSNAITADGHLVNIDGSGNRVASLTFGPRKVIVVAGINKIVRDREAAMSRIKNEAAPLNFYRLGLPSPCAKSTFCADCSPPARFCRITAVTEVRPAGIPEFVVIIVGRNLGL